jgi:co-chaperonin GroES (HSP10)
MRLLSNQVKCAGKNVALDIQLDSYTTPEQDPERKKLYMQLNGMFQIGKIVNYGSSASDDNWCPELHDKELKYGIIGDFDGFRPPTQDMYMKVVSSHAILAMTKKYKDMTVDDIAPTGQRVLIKLIEKDTKINGFEVEESDNPREATTQMAEILKISKIAGELDPGATVGSIVVIDESVGNLLISTKDTKIKTVNVNDILIYITKK